ncbi:predicted protein [Streptomyces viridosporus ATCC 14672]|uniref:Predicted protein n=1 Tax=Streptomyces viridosporus (strain ATCC 14672 / DSM 40746 / JCM 4963 / KCTC 9882 / NRRL B-12104 / FH 1290) TaxID=566461 RepID=D6A1Q9_STRV1|nr:predicted protein [Streptomyces viridosporus ATCC 14672]
MLFSLVCARFPLAELPGELPVTRSGVVSYACAHPPEHAVCRGVIKRLKGCGKGGQVAGRL